MYLLLSFRRFVHLELKQVLFRCFLTAQHGHPEVDGVRKNLTQEEERVSIRLQNSSWI